MELLKTLQRGLVDLTLWRPTLSIAAILVMTAALATRIPLLTSDADMLSFIPRGDPAYYQTLELEQQFGSTQLARIIVVRDDHPDGVFNPETLALLAEITDWLRSRPDYETERNSDLRSISTVNRIEADEDGMIVEPFMKEPPTDRASSLAIRRALEENSAYAGVLASKDGRALSILVRESETGSHRRIEYISELLAYLDAIRARGRPEKLYATGRPVMEALFGLYIPQESQRMGPIVIAMLSMFLFLSFRTLRAVLLPFFVIACTEIWMLGLLSLWGRPIYTVTSILPVLIMAIAVADAIHLLSHYYEIQAKEPGLERGTVVRRTMTSMNAPVLMTSLTTAAGFLTMRTSAIVPISDFGTITTFGIAAAYLITVIGLPAILALLPLQPPRWRHGPDVAHRGGGLDRALRATTVGTLHPKPVVGAFSLALLLGVIGLAFLTIDSSQINQFRPGHFLREADEVDNTRFSGSQILDVVIDAGANDGIKDPGVLARMDALQREMETMAIVGDTLSIAELIKRMNRVMNEDRPEAEVLPVHRDLVAQYLLLYSISGDPGDFDDLVDYDYRTAHMMILLRDSGTAAAREAVAHAHEVADRLFPADPGEPTVKFSGPAMVRANLESYIARSQIFTVAVCAPVLFAMMWALFGSAAVALLCIGPVSLAIIGIYGGMGLIGLPTDIGTTMLGGMTLGIGIDFAIHYAWRYRQFVREGIEPRQATRETAATAGRAIFYNAIVLLGGFLVLLGARLFPQVKLGALVSATMVICFLATMCLFPVVLPRLRLGATTVGEPTVRDA
jgi:predicted RND superfamily exporter protein